MADAEKIATTEAAAVDVTAFIEIVSRVEDELTHQFFDTFKEFQGRPFHMTGESYGVSILRWLR